MDSQFYERSGFSYTARFNFQARRLTENCFARALVSIAGMQIPVAEGDERCFVRLCGWCKRPT
eukprot:6200612-Pleurochrysis_carterae.AAC.1